MKTLFELAAAIETYFTENQTLSSIQNLLPLLEQYSGEDWREYVTYSNECYTRNYVVRKPEYEIIVLCWQQNQGSPIHNHAERGCLLKVLEGELLEEKYLHNSEIKQSNCFQNTITYIDNSIGLHRIQNFSTQNAVSLHIYSPGFHIPQIIHSPEDLKISL